MSDTPTPDTQSKGWSSDRAVDPDLSLGYQVRSCFRRFDRLLGMKLAPHGIKTGYWYYLRVLWRRDGVTQRYLSDMTRVTENTTAALINGMIAAGLVTRERDEKDRRKLRVLLTPKGRALEAELLPLAGEVNRVATADISQEEVVTCLKVLRHISANLQSGLEGGGEPS